MRSGGLMAEAVDDTGLDGGAGGGDDALDGDELDFLLVSDDDDVEPEVEPEVVVEPVVEPEPEVIPEVTPDVVPEVVPEVTPEVTPEPVVEPEVTPEVKPAVEEVVNPTDAERDAQKTAWLDSVEKDFAISDEDANLIINEPEKILPKLATQIYARTMDDVQGMVRQIMQGLPQAIQQVQAQQVQTTDLNKEFHSLNPGLDKIEANELGTLIQSYAPLVNKQFPNATPQEKMKALGRTLAALKGIQLGTVAPAPVEEAVPVHTPAAPARSGVNRGKPAPATSGDEFIDMLLANPDD
jgi:hypothetical protein